MILYHLEKRLNCILKGVEVYKLTVMILKEGSLKNNKISFFYDTRSVMPAHYKLNNGKSCIWDEMPLRE